MGVLAVRLQPLNRVLQWDGQKMEFTNINDNDMLRVMIKDGISVKDGHPTDNKEMVDISAKKFISELVKHNYRGGWNLPGMPR